MNTVGSRPEDRKKVDRKTRKYFPLTDSVIEKHLLGKETIGVYPLLSDETCWFLAADFDKKTWHEDSTALMDTCREMQVPAVLERSRSGRGGHVWILFERPVPAITAQAWLRHFDAHHGTAPPARAGFLRSFLPESGHNAKGWLWELDCASPSGGAA